MIKVLTGVFSVLLASISFGDNEVINRFFDLYETVIDVEYTPILDGGTIGLRLEDQAGNICLVSIDKQNIEYTFKEPIAGYTKERLEQMDGVRLRCVYIGALHPQDQGAIRIPFKSKLEDQILSKLERMRDKNPEFADTLNHFLSEAASDRIRPVETKEEQKVDQETSESKNQGN